MVLWFKVLPLTAFCLSLLPKVLGPAMMAVWSKALPLTARCLSPLPWFEFPSKASEKVASDLQLGNGFCPVLQFSPPHTTVNTWRGI